MFWEKLQNYIIQKPHIGLWEGAKNHIYKATHYAETALKNENFACFGAF